MAPSSLGSLPADAILRASLIGGTNSRFDLIHRDEGFTAISPNPHEELKSAGQVVSQTLGPFLGTGGRTIIIDAISSTTFVPVFRQGNPQPFIYVTSASRIPFTGIPNVIRFHLGAGTVWISAPLFSSEVPPSTLVGVQISSGMLMWNGNPFLGAPGAQSSITAPATVSLSLDLVLVEQTGAPGANPPPAEFQVQTPQNVSFQFSPASASLKTSSDANVTTLGDSFTLSLASLPPTYDNSLRRLQLPFQTSKAKFQVIQQSAKLATISGSAPVTRGAWNLALITAPTTPSDFNLPLASGSGGISISAGPGLSITPPFNNATITCGACVILAEGTSFVLVGQNAIGGKASLGINLWSSSVLTFRPRQRFEIRYINSYNDFESWATVLPCIATFDRPRTIDNQRLVELSFNASLVFARRAATTTCLVAAPGNPDAPPKTFSLRNLLVQATVSAFTVSGQVTATGIANGTAALRLSVRKAIPFLPDPYTSNLDPTASIFSGQSLEAVVKWKTDKFDSIDINTILHDGANMQEAVGVPEIVIVPRAATLLDLSTNVSQFGVLFLSGDPSRPTGGSERSVKDLYLQMHASSLGVTALPAVQWEPVVTDPNPLNFPSPFRFNDNGPQTWFVTNSVTLTPVAPRQVIDNLVADYNASSQSTVSARFTLPFGLIAEASLARSNNFLFASPSLRNIQPGFSAANVAGGDQLSIGAAGRVILHPLPVQSSSPSIPGKITSETAYNATSTGTTKSVLDKLQDAFTTEFTRNPRIPVTRVDISGFGESMISDWRNSSTAPGSIIKVALEVFVGRTAKEVVQAFSILYPYAIPVVRTITIERENSSRVVRHDSGWQAVGDGQYNFPGQPALVTHPGLVKGVTDVRNIRDMTSEQSYTVPVDATVELMPVRFDCYAQMENTVLGGTARGVPALDQLGYVQITKLPNDASLSSKQYARLLQDRGPMGGPIDCVVDIGNSNLRARILRIGAGASRKDASATDYEFAITAFGAPIFPKSGGQWSFVIANSDSDILQSVDSQKGVSLIQHNAPGSPYRFADPSDLIATTPSLTYCLVNSTTSYRLLLPQPKIEISSHQISSTTSMLLADPFALSASNGPFPQGAACIPLDDPNWKLQISADSNLKLQLSSPTLTSRAMARILHNNANIRTIAYTNDESPTPNRAVITLAIDTSAAISWSLNITNLSLAIENDDMGEVSRIVGTISGSSIRPTSLTDTRVVFGPKLSAVAALVNFLEKFGPLPPLEVAFGSVSASAVINLQKLISELPGPAGDFFKNFVIDCDLKALMWSDPASSSWVITADLTFKLPLHPLPPPGEDAVAGPMIVFLAKLDIAIDDAGNKYEITYGAGYGYEGKFLTFDAYAYAALALSVTWGNSLLAVGLSLILRADIDLVIVEAQVTAEVRGDMIHEKCGAGNKDGAVWAVGQFTIALEITIFMIVDIEFDCQHEVHKNTDNGPCPLVELI